MSTIGSVPLKVAVAVLPPLQLLWGYLRPGSPALFRVQLRFSDEVWSPDGGFYGVVVPGDFMVWQRPASTGAQRIWRGDYVIPPGAGAPTFASVHLFGVNGPPREFSGEALLKYSPASPAFRGLHSGPLLSGEWVIGSE
jgi:hypothetical protein